MAGVSGVVAHDTRDGAGGCVLDGDGKMLTNYLGQCQTFALFAGWDNWWCCRACHEDDGGEVHGRIEIYTDTGWYRICCVVSQRWSDSSCSGSL